MRHLNNLVALLAGVGLSSTTLAQQDGEGITVATVALARDSASAQQATVIDYLVRKSFARNPRYSVLDIEGFLHPDLPIGSREQLQLGLSKLQRGREMYDAFELDPAVATLGEAVVAFERGAAALEDKGPYVNALLMLGAAQALKANRKAARNSLIRALTVDPRASLEGGGFPPTVLELYEEAREHTAGAALGGLSIYANPAAAEVYVDGLFRGSAPLTVDWLPAGRHVVRVYRSGFQSWGRIVDVPAGSEETVQAALQPAPQAAQFESLARRAGLEATQDGMGAATSQLGAWFKVDQLLVVLVTASGEDVTLQVAHYDAAGGQRVHAATRTFVFGSQRFRADVDEFMVGEFRQAQLGVASDTGTNTNVGGGYGPERVERGTHPGYLWGGGLVGGAVLFTALGIGFTIPAINISEKLRTMPQTDPRSPELRNEGVIDFAVAVTGYSLALVCGVGATIAFIIASTEEESVETILETPGAGGDLAAPDMEVGR